MNSIPLQKQSNVCPILQKIPILTNQALLWTPVTSLQISLRTLYFHILNNNSNAYGTMEFKTSFWDGGREGLEITIWLISFDSID